MIEYKYEELERRVIRLEARTEDIGVFKTEISNMKRELASLADQVGSLRKALYTAALSVAGGAIIFAFTVSQALR